MGVWAVPELEVLGSCPEAEAAAHGDTKPDLHGAEDGGTHAGGAGYQRAGDQLVHPEGERDTWSEQDEGGREGGRSTLALILTELMTNVLVRNVQASVAPNVSKRHQTGSFLT